MFAGYSLAEETLTIDVAQNAEVHMDTPDTNHHGSAWLRARRDPEGESRKIYIQFDLSGYAGTVLDIDNFEFFHSSYNRPRSANLWLVTGDDANNWDETTITWNNAPANDVSHHQNMLSNEDFTSTIVANIAQPEADVAQTVTLTGDMEEQFKQMVIDELNSENRKATFVITRSTDRYVQYAAKEQFPLNHPIRMDVTFDSADPIEPDTSIRIIAQPESREVYAFGEIIDTTDEEPNSERARAGYNSDPLYDGNLVLVFRLPELPEGEVVTSATFNFFYISRASQRAWPNNDLYGLPYIPGDQTPVSFADHYVGSNDASNMKIASNIFDDDRRGQWIGTNPEGLTLAAYLQEQYNNGAVAGDWVRLRFSPLLIMTVHQNHQIYGPGAEEELLRPYIELDTAPATEGYWQVLELEGPHSILETGIVSGDAQGFLGSSSQQTRALLFPFKFPELAANQYVAEVKFTAIMDNPYLFPGRYFDIDLYGLPYRSSSSFQSSDYWIGPYSLWPEEGLNGMPLASRITEDYATGQPRVWTLGEEGSQRAACYINAQRAAGATDSSYGFFRMSPRYNHLYYTRQMVLNPEIAVRISTEEPTCPTEAPETEYACPVIGYTDYPAGDITGDCMVTLADLQIMLGDWLECNAEPASYYCP